MASLIQLLSAARSYVQLVWLPALFMFLWFVSSMLTTPASAGIVAAKWGKDAFEYNSYAQGFQVMCYWLTQPFWGSVGDSHGRFVQVLVCVIGQVVLSLTCVLAGTGPSAAVPNVAVTALVGLFGSPIPTFLTVAHDCAAAACPPPSADSSSGDESAMKQQASGAASQRASGATAGCLSGGVLIGLLIILFVDDGAVQFQVRECECLPVARNLRLCVWLLLAWHAAWHSHRVLLPILTRLKISLGVALFLLLLTLCCRRLFDRAQQQAVASSLPAPTEQRMPSSQPSPSTSFASRLRDIAESFKLQGFVPLLM